MYKKLSQNKSKNALNEISKSKKFKINEDGLFVLKDGRLVQNPNRKEKENAKSTATADYYYVKDKDLIPDNNGAFYRNWRPEIKSTDDIWNEIVRVTKLPGVTSAPKQI